MKKIVKGEEVEKKLGLKDQLQARPFGQGSSSGFSVRGVVSKQELASKEKSEKILEEAQKEANQIRSEAERLLGQVREKTENEKKRGYEDGKQAGYSEWTEEILKVRQLKKDFYEEAERDVIKLVLSIAEKVIGSLVTENEKAIAGIVKQALEKSLGDRIVVRMHPNDFKRIKKEDIHFGDFLDKTKQVHFKEDSSIEPGGCIVETEVGTIDAQLETQLKAIRKALGV